MPYFWFRDGLKTNLGIEKGAAVLRIEEKVGVVSLQVEIRSVYRIGFASPSTCFSGKLPSTDLANSKIKLTYFFMKFSPNCQACAFYWLSPLQDQAHKFFHMNLGVIVSPLTYFSSLLLADTFIFSDLICCCKFCSETLGGEETKSSSILTFQSLCQSPPSLF